jgi:hypothetical protein
MVALSESGRHGGGGVNVAALTFIEIFLICYSVMFVACAQKLILYPVFDNGVDNNNNFSH